LTYPFPQFPRYALFPKPLDGGEPNMSKLNAIEA
jgi:hypothetical protein